MYIRGICIYNYIYIYIFLNFCAIIYIYRGGSQAAINICIYIYMYIYIYVYIPESRIQPLKNILASILTVTAQNVASQSICFEQVFIVGQA